MDAEFSGSNENSGIDHNSTPNRQVQRGDQINFYCPEDDARYQGVIKTLHRNGEVTVHYGDGDKERFALENEQWEFEDEPNHGTGCSGNIFSTDTIIEDI